MCWHEQVSWYRQRPVPVPSTQSVGLGGGGDTRPLLPVKHTHTHTPDEHIAIATRRSVRFSTASWWEILMPVSVGPRGRWELAWAFPPGLPDNGTLVEESRCGRGKEQHCSLLTVSSPRAQHTGAFRCRYRQQPDKQASVYVYVPGNTHTHTQISLQRSAAQRCIFRSAG